MAPWKPILAVAGLLALEAWCAHMAWYTLGEVMSGLYWMALLIGNLLAAVQLLYSRRFAVQIALFLGLAIVPWQLWLVYQHQRLRGGRHGRLDLRAGAQYRGFPGDLHDYKPLHPGLAPHFYLTDSAEHGGFYLDWYVGARTTKYWYSPADGWRYYPD
ncbi:MAG: hypothetical protein R3E96_17075 [Planctomycetota bacterium]